MKWLGLNVHYFPTLIRNILSFVHILKLVLKMLEIAFSGIEISKFPKGACPQKIPWKKGTKSPLLIQSVTLFNLLAMSIILLKPLTPIFHHHCQKKNMHIDISLNWSSQSVILFTFWVFHQLSLDSMIKA